MEFRVNKKLKSNLERYSRDAFHTSADFSKELIKEGKDFIKAIVLFGSASRRTRKPHDIDVLVIIDDVSIHLNKELIHTYRIIVQEIIAKVSKKLHITTLKFTSFWEYVRVGDPVAINMLREGYPLIDTNFFVPLQRLLQQGRIRPTPESVYTYFHKAKTTMYNASWHILQSVVDLYWAAIDASHATIMSLGILPVAPDELSALMRERLVKTNLLGEKHVELVQELYDLQKEITRGQRKEISAKEYDVLTAKTADLLKALEKIIRGK